MALRSCVDDALLACWLEEGMRMDLEFCTVERDGHVMTVTINRPEARNALHPPANFEFGRVFDAFDSDPDLWIAIITGTGKAFCAGADLKADPGNANSGPFVPPSGFAGLTSRFDRKKPVIAAINGFAMGGGFELALACDFLVASETASFAFPEITLNTLPGWGGTQLAVAKLGLAAAKRFVLGGRRHAARECEAYGFIHDIVPPDALFDTVLALASTLAAHDPFAVEMAKRALNRAYELPLSTGFDFEAAQYAVNFSGEGARAGLQRFIAQRAARRNGANASSHDTASVSP
jgi:enoyl-CoA hydratase/carnithine racemase